MLEAIASFGLWALGIVVALNIGIYVLFMLVAGIAALFAKKE